MNNFLNPEVTLPPNTSFELSGSKLQEARLESTHFHGGVIAVKHGIIPSAEEGILPLTPKEEIVLGLGATGLSESKIADAIYRSVDTIKVHKRNVFNKLQASGKHRLASAITMAHARRIFHVEKAVEITSPPDSDTVELLRIFANGGTRDNACNALDFSLDDINELIRSAKQIYQLQSLEAMVFFGHVTGVLPTDSE